jgi:hypothetical protein
MYAVSLVASLDSPLDISVPVLTCTPINSILVTVYYLTFTETDAIECQADALSHENLLFFFEKETAWDVAEYLRGGTPLRIERSDYRRPTV